MSFFLFFRSVDSILASIHKKIELLHEHAAAEIEKLKAKKLKVDALIQKIEGHTFESDRAAKIAGKLKDLVS